MEHRYQTRRNELRDISNCLTQLAVMRTVNSASVEDLVRIVRREDTLISDQALRDCVLPHSSHLGVLVRMIEEVSVHHGACKDGDLMRSLDPAWRQRLCGTGTFSDAQIAQIESIASSLRKTREEMSAVEGSDPGSSSPSDYSDSGSSSDDGDTDGEDEEEEEEEEDEAPSLPSRRRRR
jgi:hypothetical protein